MTDIRLKAFQRLVARTEALSDVDALRENIAVVDSRFNDLRNAGVLSPDDAREYQSRIRRAQRRLAPAAPAAVRRAKTVEPRRTVGDIEAEQRRHEEIATELIGYTELIRDNVARLSVASKADAEVLEQVQAGVTSAQAGAVRAGSDMRVVKSERVGWRAYLWVANVIAIFLLVRFIFQ